MTDTKQCQLIFENWRRYSSSTINETPIYSYTGSVANPKDPTKAWDPETVTQTAVTGAEEVGHGNVIAGYEAAVLEDNNALIEKAAIAGGLALTAVAAASIWRLSKRLGGTFRAAIKSRGLKNGIAYMLRKGAVRAALLAVGFKVALLSAALYGVYRLWQANNPAIAVDHPDGPGTEGYIEDVAAGKASIGIRSWQEASKTAIGRQIQCNWCKENEGKPHPEVKKRKEREYTVGSAEKIRFDAIVADVRKVGPFCKDILKNCAPGRIGPTEHTDKDVDALMRMLKAETSWARSTPEMSAIIQVAINRRTAKGRKDFLSVVAPRTSGWNNASKSYARNFNNAHNYYGTPRAKKARQLIVDILKNGSSTGDLGGAQNWLHPYGMPKTDRPSKEIWTVTRPSGKKSTYISHDFGGKLGKRQLPLWAVHVSDGGSSKSMPTFVGSMLYSKGGGRSSKPSTTAVIIKSNKGDASKVIGIGDSITAGRNSWIDRIGGKKLARGGWSSTKIRNNIFNKYIITEKGKVVNKPKTLVIFAGINNRGNPNRVIKDLGYMSKKAQEKGIDVKLVKLFPSASRWKVDQRASTLKNIEKINNWISNEKWKTRAGSGAVETASMSDSKGVLRNSKDGVHPNRKGQQELASLIGDAIKA